MTGHVKSTKENKLLQCDGQIFECRLRKILTFGVYTS